MFAQIVVESFDYDVSVHLGNSGIIVGTVQVPYFSEFLSFTYNGAIGWNGAYTEPDNTMKGPFQAVAYSPSGNAAGYYGTDNPAYQYARYDASGFISIDPLSPLAVSDSGLVLGDNTKAADAHDSLAVFDGYAVRQLAPLVMKPYTGRIRFPRSPQVAWINANSDIVVSAEVKDDSDPINVQWIPETLLLENALLQNSDKPQTISIVHLPEDAILAAFNNNQVFAATAHTPVPMSDGTTNQQVVGGFAERTWFQAQNINLGFDPPIKGDQQPNGVSSVPDKFNDNWTSVISGAGSANSTNTNISFALLSSPVAPKLKVGVTNYNDPKGGASVGAIPINPIGDVTATIDATGKVATAMLNISVAGTASGATQQRANVVIKGTRNVLHVDVLPLQTIPINIWYLEDSRPMPGVTVAPGESDFRVAPVPPGFPTPAAIIKRLNDIYTPQAGINFVVGVKGVLDVPFDGATFNSSGWGPDINPNGVLDVQATSISSPEIQKVIQALGAGNLKVVNLVLLTKMSVTDLGDTPPGIKCSFVQSSPYGGAGSAYTMDVFLITCAHEIGHQLGLSTHTFLDSKSPKRHDQGLYPWQYYYFDGTAVPFPNREQPQAPNEKQRLIQALMKQETPSGDWRWIRHEDWEMANTSAQKLH